MSDPDTPTAPPKAVSDHSAPAPDMSGTYTVNRSQDGAQVRAQLTLGEAQSECAILNAQARQQRGVTAPVLDNRGQMVRAAEAIYGSMFHGAVARYEIRSASGLVV